MIQLQSLTKTFGKQQVLKSIDLTIDRGTIHGVVGENGAGKTTLFRCLAGMENCKGTLSYDKGAIRNNVGFLDTNPTFLSKLTGKEYLQLLCNARNMEYRNDDRSNIFELPLGKYADSYSTGMKKKLALTGLLLQKNDIYILDEPFNGVDIHSNLIINQVLRKLKELDKIIILSSHIFSTLVQTCDYLHYLKGGIIEKSVGRKEFDAIEKKMKADGIAAKIDKLDLG